MVPARACLDVRIPAHPGVGVVLPEDVEAVLRLLGGQTLSDAQGAWLIGGRRPRAVT